MKLLKFITKTYCVSCVVSLCRVPSMSSMLCVVCFDGCPLPFRFSSRFATFTPFSATVGNLILIFSSVSHHRILHITAGRSPSPASCSSPPSSPLRSLRDQAGVVGGLRRCPPPAVGVCWMPMPSVWRIPGAVPRAVPGGSPPPKA